MTNKTTQLYEGDAQCGTLLEALQDLLRERAYDMPLPSVLGVLDILKHTMIARICDE